MLYWASMGSAVLLLFVAAWLRDIKLACSSFVPSTFLYSCFLSVSWGYIGRGRIKTPEFSYLPVGFHTLLVRDRSRRDSQENSSVHPEVNTVFFSLVSYWVGLHCNWSLDNAHIVICVYINPLWTESQPLFLRCCCETRPKKKKKKSFAEIF